MADNRYDNTTRPEGNSIDEAARVSTEQQRTNAQQQQAQAAQQTVAPDPAVQVVQNRQDQEVRKQQSTGASMSIW